MSLVGILVVADDGRFYREPVLFGDDWFLCFDDDDPPEIIIAREESGRHRSKTQCLERAKEIFHETGIVATVRDNSPACSTRCFPPYSGPDGSWNRLKEAAAFDLNISQPIPAGIQMEHKGSMSRAEWDEKQPQGVVWFFEN